MDNYEKMRRLNNLTKELKQRGFAESSFEAIQQANQIYGEDELSHDVAHGIIRSSPHEKMQNSGEEQMDQNVNNKIKALSDNMELLTAKMNEMIKAINDIDERIKELKNRPPVEKVVHVERSTPVNSEPVREREQPQQESKPKEEYNTNQRTGNFTGQDVAIDKMFYYGKK